MSATLIFVSLLATLLVTAYLFVKNKFSYWKRRGVPFKEPSFPFGNFSDSFMGKKSGGQVIEDLYNGTTEPFIGVFSTLQPGLLIRDPKLIKEIHVKDFQSFHTRGWQANVDVDPMADNILLQEGEKGKHVRAQLSPAFSSGKLKAMFDVIVNCARSMDKYIGDYADKDKSVEVRDVFVRYATNVIVSVAFGIDIDCIVNRDEKFRILGSRFFEPTVKNMLRGSLSIMTPKLAKFLKVRFVDKEVGDFMIDTMRQNLEYRESNNISRKDFFQMLMQLRNTGEIQDNNDDWTTKATTGQKTISVEEMAAHAHLVFVGGYESSSTTMSFLLYELAKHPELQQQVYEEIVDTLGKHDGQLTYDAVADMKYLAQCLDESLRLHPPFPFNMRKCTKDYKIPNTNVVIEEGTILFFSMTGLQYDPKYYDEPAKFKPERQSEAYKAGKTFVDMPNLTFGDGPRNCLGMRFGKLQSKIAIVLLLRKFRFELDDQHKNMELKLNPYSPTPYPINGINLRVFNR